MSGFDFDSLRDPDAPVPGSRERDRVSERARHIRARQLRTRVAISATAFMIVTGAVLGVVALQRQSGPSITVEGPTSTAAASVADRFVPATSIDNGIVTVPVTLPDGETLTMQYPESLQIAQLGFSGTMRVQWPVSRGASSCCGADVSISYTTVAQVFGSRAAIKTYTGAHGRPVRLLNVPQSSDGGPSLSEVDLVYQFGPWLVRVGGGRNPLKLSEAQLATWARSLDGTVDSNGYLVLHAQAPLSISGQFDGGFAPIDVGNFVRLTTHSTNRSGQITCGPHQSDTSAHRYRSLTANGWRGYSWCVGNALHVAVGGSSHFIALANSELGVSSLGGPSRVSATTTTTTSTAPATTTTTAPRVTSPDAAESASFVSPEHGWVLGLSGNIDETTDAGTTWTQIVHIGAPADRGERLRFADSRHGYAFNLGATTMMTTDDGGAHWRRTAGPFSSISDLVISHGVVYVVGVPKTSSQNFSGFRIWSSPVGGMQWSMDPLVIPVGAGPVPEQSLVFSGNQGWMVNNDRDFISGARLSTTTGRWSTWKPPCTGEARLAASTSHDLVVACGPPFATSASAWTVAFSHDGGDTFGKPSVPGSGFVQSGPFSPSPDVAVVAVTGGLYRSTEGGASWHLVLPADASRGYADYGFTTSTQGFAIFGGSGEMLMTYDAGVTWQKVMGP